MNPGAIYAINLFVQHHQQRCVFNVVYISIPPYPQICEDILMRNGCMKSFRSEADCKICRNDGNAESTVYRKHAFKTFPYKNTPNLPGIFDEKRLDEIFSEWDFLRRYTFLRIRKRNQRFLPHPQKTGHRYVRLIHIYTWITNFTFTKLLCYYNCLRICTRRSARYCVSWRPFLCI